jgi:hypothetical protein
MTENDEDVLVGDDEGLDDEREIATLVAAGLLGAAVGAGIGLLLSRAAVPPEPAFSPRRAVARTRGELEDFAERIERELRSLRRLVKRQRRRGWLR